MWLKFERLMVGTTDVIRCVVSTVCSQEHLAVFDNGFTNYQVDTVVEGVYFHHALTYAI